MSKRKREESVGDGAEEYINETSTKREAKEKVEVCKTAEPELVQKSKDRYDKKNVTDNKNGTVAKTTVTNETKTEAIIEEIVINRKNETATEKIVTGCKSETVGTKRKRSDSSEGEPSAKQIKTDIKEDLGKKPVAKKIYKKRK